MRAALDTVAELLTGRFTGLPRGTDWDAVTAVIRGGRLEAITLHIAGSQLPEAVAKPLRQRARKIAFSAVYALREQPRILGALNSAGVQRTVLLKGAVLGWLVYPDPALRSTNDLDLLVSRSDAQRAHEALLGLGYTEQLLFPNRSASARQYHERVYWRDTAAGSFRQIVEVHTGFAQRFRHPVPYERLVERAHRFEPAQAYRLDDADQLLHLAVHMAREQFLGPLKQLYDVHLWLSRGGLNWNHVVKRALKWGAATSLAEALRLAEDVFGSPVDPGALDALRPRGLRQSYLEWWHNPNGQSLVRKPVSMRTAQTMALLPLLDSTAQRSRFVSRYAALRLRDLLTR